MKQDNPQKKLPKLLTHLLSCVIILSSLQTSHAILPDKFRSSISQHEFGRRAGQFPEFPPQSRGSRHPGGNCDQTISSETAWFFSPNYPLDYDPNTLCIFTIERAFDDVCQLEFMFEDFDLEDSRPSCTEDYLELGPGNRLCGSLIPDFSREYFY